MLKFCKFAVFLILLLTTTALNNPNQNEYIVLPGGELMLVLGDETLVNSDHVSEQDSIIILNGLSLSVKHDTLDNVLKFKERINGVRPEGFISTEDALKIKQHNKD